MAKLTMIWWGVWILALCPTGVSADRREPSMWGAVVATIRDGDGPLENVSVTLIREGFVSSGRCGCASRDRSSSSRVNGLAVLELVPPGTYHAVFRRYRYQSVTVDSVRVDSGGVTGLTVQMVKRRRRSGRIEGRVLHGDCDEPIAGGRLYIGEPPELVNIDKEGRFTLEDIPFGELAFSFSRFARLILSPDTIMVSDATRSITLTARCAQPDSSPDWTDDEPDFCLLHSRKMKKVLMPVGPPTFSYRPKYDRTRARLFPYGDVHFSWRVHRHNVWPTTVWYFVCDECMAACRNWLLADFDSALTTPHPDRQWQRLAVANTFSISTPPVVSSEETTSSCNAEGALESELMRIEYSFGRHPEPLLRLPARNQIVGWGEAIDGLGTYMIATRQPVEGKWVVMARFRNMKDDGESMNLAVRFANVADRAAAVDAIRSVRIIR